MNLPSDTIDPRMVQGIVRAVLERLQSDPSEASPAAAELFHHRLITVETLQQITPGQKRIVVPARAIVTPAAADEAKLRNLIIERACPAATAVAAQPVQASLWIADADREQRAATISTQLNSRGVNIATRSLSAAIDGLVDGEVKTVVALSDLPAPVVCNACRHSSVRAAAIRSLDELQRIATAMRPNLWVLDMHAMALPQAVALVERCVRLSATGALS